jgi:hypothetical protein
MILHSQYYTPKHQSYEEDQQGELGIRNSKKPQPLLYWMRVFQSDEIGEDYTVKPDGTDGWNVCSFFLKFVDWPLFFHPLAVIFT